jgi:5-methylcytosine-specific restriction protein A
MQGAKVNLLRETLEQGTGAEVVVEPHSSGTRAGLRSYFSGLTPNQGPSFSLAPTGLKRHRLNLQFGRFSLCCIEQMQAASIESLAVARALIQQIASKHQTTLTPTQSLTDWVITGSEFQIEVLILGIEDPAGDNAIVRSATEVMVPLMASMAELIGYDETEVEEEDFDEEGRVTHSTVKRRERSPRNRLLALSIHGHRCGVCGFEPTTRYGEAGAIIEVHHLEAVSNLAEPRPYDPRTDLIPLCPNCHRAVHTRRPVPYSIDELRGMLGDE